MWVKSINLSHIYMCGLEVSILNLILRFCLLDFETVPTLWYHFAFILSLKPYEMEVIVETLHLCNSMFIVYRYSNNQERDDWNVIKWFIPTILFCQKHVRIWISIGLYLGRFVHNEIEYRCSLCWTVTVFVYNDLR
jgi:hypothetical protein